MNLTRMTAAAAIAACMCATAAPAATVSAYFELGALGSTATPSISLTHTSGLSLTVTAESYGGLGRTVSRWPAGIGSTSAGDTSDQVDSNGTLERLVFSFSREVSLDRIEFSGVQPWDRFDLMRPRSGALKSEGIFDVSSSFDASGITSPSSVFALGAFGSETAFFVGKAPVLANDDDCVYVETIIDAPEERLEIKRTCYSGFKVTGINVTFDERDAPSSVPVPAGILLLASGLLGLGATRRFRR